MTRSITVNGDITWHRPPPKPEAWPWQAPWGALLDGMDIVAVRLESGRLTEAHAVDALRAMERVWIADARELRAMGPRDER
jgi:hypothetical protein